MEQETKQTTDFLRLVAWMHANRKVLIAVATVVVVVGAGIGFYNWNKSNRETQANEALSNIAPPTSAEESSKASADPYLKVADDFKGTAGGARAMLIAGGILFDAGKYPDARKVFEQFLGEYQDYPLADQALLGVDASYEAEGNLTEAATRYKEFIDHHSTSSTLPQAKSALARVYVAQNRPELALQQYEDLERGRNNDSWSAEAGIQREELLNKYPNLRKAPPAPIAPPTVPNLNVTPKAAAPMPTSAPATNLTGAPSTPAPAKP